MPSTAHFKILSLDGGGSWALIQAMTLYEIYKTHYGDAVTGHQVLENFDYAGANSGGSIVLAALMQDWPLKQLVDFFLSESKRREIFVELGFWEKPISEKMIKLFTGVGPKYDTEAKLRGFKKNLNPLDGAKPNSSAFLEDIYHQYAVIEGKKFPHVLITTFDYDRQRALFCRSDVKSGTMSGQHNSVTLAEAVHGASNAPVNYFNKPAMVSYGDPPQRRCWDGAVGGNNNPVLALCTEVTANMGRYNPNRLPFAILSIGTGSTFLPLKGYTPYNAFYDNLLALPEDQSVSNDMKVIAGSILQDPPDTASYVAHTMIQAIFPDSEMVRLSPLIQPELLPNSPVTENSRWHLPKANPATGLSSFFTITQFEALAKLNMDAVIQSDVLLIKLLCENWLKSAALNQPIQTGPNLSCNIGDPYFSDALPKIIRLFR